MSYSDFCLRIGFALVASFLIGLERQWRRRAIGLRTNVLVCIGSFFFASLDVMKGSGDLRVAAQVVSGIGFLGAGVILKDGTNIKGLNTAATLWCNAAIGVLCAYGLLLEASSGTILILMSNIVLRFISRKLMTMNTNDLTEKYTIKIIANYEKELVLRTMLTQSITDGEMNLNGLDTRKNDNKIEITANVTLTQTTQSIDHLITRFTMEPDVYYVNYTKCSNLLDDDEN